MKQQGGDLMAMPGGTERHKSYKNMPAFLRDETAMHAEGWTTAGIRLRPVGRGFVRWAFGRSATPAVDAHYLRA